MKIITQSEVEVMAAQATGPSTAAQAAQAQGKIVVHVPVIPKPIWFLPDIGQVNMFALFKIQKSLPDWADFYQTLTFWITRSRIMEKHEHIMR